MFTRFHDDDVRIKKQLEIQTRVGRYQLDVPGNGMDLGFHEDPNLRLQKWGANLYTNTTNVESDLLGLSRKYCRDEMSLNDYERHRASTKKITYDESRSEKPFVCESRVTVPAWTFRGVEIPRWEEPFLNPQAFTEIDFRHNIHTRILEKDHFQRR